MDIHNYEGFCENFTYRMSVIKERMTPDQGTHESLIVILSFIVFLSLKRALKWRFNCLMIVRIPLEARHLNNFENSFK